MTEREEFFIVAGYRATVLIPENANGGKPNFFMRLIKPNKIFTCWVIRAFIMK